jgi:hypothetical protein
MLSVLAPDCGGAKLSDLENDFSADINGVIQIREEVGEDQRGHVAHDDLAELVLPKMFQNFLFCHKIS